MRLSKIVLLTVAKIILGLTLVHANEPATLVLNDEEKVYLIGSIAQVYEDKNSKVTIQTIISPVYSAQFKNIGTDFPNLGVSKSTFWIRFRLKSTTDFRAFLFNIGYLFHDKLEMYRIVKGLPEEIFFSDIKTGAISHEHHKRDRFAVPIELKTDEINEYYLCIKDHEGISMFLELSSEENFLKRQVNDSLRVGLISGVFLLASIFALIVFYRDKQKSLLLFFLFNLCFVLNLLCHNGNLQILLWPGNLRLNHDFYIFSGFATNFFSFLFTVCFLELEHKKPLWCKAGIVLAVIMALGALSPLVGMDHFLIPFYFTQAIGSLFEVAIAFIALREGLKLSKPFFISRVIYSSSTFIYALIKIGYLPFLGPDYDLIVGLGLCFQVCLLAYVITDYRYKIEIGKLEEEKDKEKQRNEELRQANKIKMEFLGMASHDLKGPLRNISALSSFIENKQITNEEEIIHMSGMIRQSSEKLANLVKDLLDNTALEMGKLELKLAEVNALKCIQGIIEQYELEAKRKNQTIHIIANLENKLTICVDEIRFTQVVENLISNAIKFSPYDKNIWVILSKPENASFRIEVKDEGPGFTEEDKMYLFNYYKKLSAKPTGKESSSGLGLSIVKKILQLHNGKIWLESEKGKGASFFVEI